MKFYQEPSAAVYCGHDLMELPALPSESVDCVMTSPPYWGLRTYKTEPQIWGENHCEHEWGDRIEHPMSKSGKHQGELGSNTNLAQDSARFNPNGLGNFCLKCHAWRGELGLEPTIELYISHLIQIFDEVKRVLKKTGTCWVNIDDSYAGGKGQSGCGDAEYQENRTDATLNKPYHQMGGHGLTRPADGKIGVPAKSLCLIPSRFALAMAEHGWILRNDIVWYKSNPMPESVKDRFTGTWEHLFFFVKSQRYWFEQQFEPQQEESLLRAMRGWDGSTDRDYPNGPQSHINKYFNKTKEEIDELRIRGRNKRDVWQINTEPTPQWHGIKNFATFPEKLCETPILSGCSKDGVVLDPFCGSGKALAVAKRLGRKCIGIDLNPDYCKLTVKELQKISMPMELV